MPRADGLDNSRAFADELLRRRIPGIALEATEFTPRVDRYAGQLCHGVRIRLLDRAALDAPVLGIEIAAVLERLYTSQFIVPPLAGMVGSRAIVAQIERGAAPSKLQAEWQPALRAFERLRARYLLYP